MKKPKKIRSKEGLSILVLPRDNSEMHTFVEENKALLFAHVVETIEHAVKGRWNAVELFTFHKSNFVVLVNHRDYRDNVELAYQYSKEVEDYDLCGKAKKVIDLLDRMSFVLNYKIKPKKSNVEAETPPKKAAKRNRKK